MRKSLRCCYATAGFVLCFAAAKGQEQVGQTSPISLLSSSLRVEWQRQMDCGERSYNEGRLPQAEKCFTEAILLAGQLPASSVEMAQALTNLSVILTDQGRLPEAEKVATRAVKAFRKCRDHGVDLASGLRNLALVYRRQNRLYDAEQALAEALRLFSAGENNARETAGVLHVLGTLELDRGRLEAAKGYFQSGISLTDKIADASVFRANLYSALSSTLLRLGRYREATESARSSLAIAASGRAADGLEMAVYWCALGAAASADGNYALAEKALSQAQDYVSLAGDPLRLEAGTVLSGFANLRFWQRRYPEAAEFQRRAVAIFERQVSSAHPQVLELKAYYAVMLRKTNQKDEAKEIERQVREASRTARLDLGTKHTIGVSDLRREAQRLR